MRQGREIRNITFIGFLAGVIYTLLADNLNDPAPVINAFLIGTIGGFFSGTVELFVFSPKLKRPEFAQTVFLKVITYFLMLTLLILVIKGRVDSLFLGQGFFDYVQSDPFLHFITDGEFKIILLYAFSIIVLIIFTIQVNKYLGKGVFLNLITGRYHDPKFENRILLLIDMKGSTSIAEELDPISYYQLLDRFFFDVYAGVREYSGSIYRYVGDQVTITWPVKSPDANVNCIHAFFAIKKQIQQQREWYMLQFGFVPEFKGTAHIGRVVSGELGDVRSQIVYYGTPLMEVAKMEKSDNRRPSGLCISKELSSSMNIPEIYQITEIKPMTDENHYTLLEVTTNPI